MLRFAVVRFEEGFTDYGEMIPKVKKGRYSAIVLKRFADRDAAQSWCDERYGEWNEFYGVLCDD